MFVQKRGNLRLEHLFENLNPEQQEAVTATEGYIRVIAGAGSGKTRALARRFAYLVNELGILPGNILCVTFTNKSANEMRQRIHQLTGDSDTGYINTFHGFCVSVLQEDIYALGYPKNFLVLDNADIDEMLKIIYEERHLTLRDMTFAQARDMFEMRKCVDEPDYYKKLITLPTDELKKLYDDAADRKDILFYGYLYQQKKCFGLDYNDLIKFTLYLFSINNEIRLKWQKRLEYIMIDEFQDIDALQYKLMEVLCRYHGNLFVVGDPDQTIYSWRGARVGYLLDFARAFPNAQTIMMNRNYRSTPQVLHAVNALISANTERIPKDLVPVRGDGAPVVCHLGETQEQESAFIAAQIQSLHRDGLPYGDITILYRAHYQTRTVEAALCSHRTCGTSLRPDPHGRGCAAEGKNSIPHLQRGAILCTKRNPGRHSLSSPYRVSGRPVFPPHSKRAEAQYRRAAHGISQRLCRTARHNTLSGSLFQSGQSAHPYHRRTGTCEAGGTLLRRIVRNANLGAPDGRSA